MTDVACRECGYPNPILGYDTYGGQIPQYSGHGTIGRWSPDMVRLRPDGASFEIGMRFDRAAYLLLREAGADHDFAVRNSMLCGAWSGQKNVTGNGTWAFEAKLPKSKYVEYVGMLWPQDNDAWPRGEINLLEGIVGSGVSMTNLHWGPSPEEAEHSPQNYLVDATLRHKYSVKLTNSTLFWYLDDKLIRGYYGAPQIPNELPLHMVFQCGVNASILSYLANAYEEDLRFEEWIEFKPLQTP